MGEEVERLKREMGNSLVNWDKLISEIKAECTPPPSGAAPLGEDSEAALQAIEARLVGRMAEYMQAFTTKISDQVTASVTSLEAKFEPIFKEVTAMKAGMPEAVRVIGEQQMKANIPAIVKELGSHLDQVVESKLQQTLAAMGTGGGAPAGAGGEASGDAPSGGGMMGFSLSSLIRQLTPVLPQILEVVKIWKAPTPEQAIAQQMITNMRWMQFGAKMKSGSASAEQLAQEVMEIAGAKPPEKK